jgi:oxygen-dependent protoporphyrinogen oxidase
MTTRVAVIGGGISGLTTAYYLKRASIERGIELTIDLFEKSDGLGGVIRSEKVDGMLLEAGPEGWVSYKPWPKKLLKDLELEDEILGSNDHLRRTFIVREGRLTKLPEGMAFLAPVDPISFWKEAPMSVRGKLRASFEPFVSRSSGELSIGAFFERRLGGEFTETFVDPLVSAIYGADLGKLSMPVTMPELYRVEQRTGSLWKGLRKLAKMTLSNSVLLSMKDGMSSLISRLENELQDVRIHLGVKDIRCELQDQKFEVVTAGQRGTYEQVAVCTPAHAAGRILSESLPSLSAILSEVPYASTSLVYLAYKREEFSHPLDGFGFIVPSGEAQAVDACTWVSTKFDDRCPPDRVLLRCAIHDRRRASIPESDEAIVEAVDSSIRSILGVSCAPVFGRVYHVRGVIPQLYVGHQRRVGAIRSALEKHPGLYLAGSYYGGVGLPECIRTGQEIADQIIAKVTKSEPRA